MEYFKYYAQIDYSNQSVVNILARNKIRDYLKNNTYLYDLYDVKDYERPDIIANNYYGNYKYTWLIFYANNIYDPCLDWVLNESEFLKYLDNKYKEVPYSGGSNYKIGDLVQYDSTLFKCTTNHLSELPINGVRLSDTQYIRDNGLWSTDFLVGKFAFFYSSYLPNNDGVWLTITQNNGTVLTVDGVLPVACDRVLMYNDAYWVLGGDNQELGIPRPGYRIANTTIHEYRDDVHNFVVDSEYTGAKHAITHYDYELDLNESRRHIKLIDRRYAPQILLEFKKLFGV